MALLQRAVDVEDVGDAIERLGEAGQPLPQVMARHGHCLSGSAPVLCDARGLSPCLVVSGRGRSRCGMGAASPRHLHPYEFQGGLILLTVRGL